MVLIIDQRFRAGPAWALLSRLISENGEITTMSTLINWLEAGRRLAERIPYSLVALVATAAAIDPRPRTRRDLAQSSVWGAAHTASSAEQSSSSCVATATPQRGAVSDPLWPLSSVVARCERLKLRCQLRYLRRSEWRAHRQGPEGCRRGSASPRPPMLELLPRQAKNAALLGASRRVPTSMYGLAISVAPGRAG